MPLDGIVIASLVNELKEKILNGRVDKIAQPETDEIALSIRGRGANYKLLLTANASAPRVHFTAQQKTSPLQAPMFCMVLRKHISGGRLVDIRQPDFERIVELDIESFNEMGDLSVKRLLIEIMGKHSNIMLLDTSGMILDSIKHVSFETSSVREVLPGKTYMRPPSKDKANPTQADAGVFRQALTRENVLGLKIQQALYQSFSGVSPIMASEICLRAGVAPDARAGELTEPEQDHLFETGFCIFNGLSDSDFQYHIYFDEQGKATDFTALPMTLYAAYRAEPFLSPSEMLEAFYRQKDTTYRLSQKTADLRKLIAGHMERCAKKRIVYEKTMSDIKDRDRLRVFGELLTAYIYAVEKGAESYAANDFYNNGAEVTIPLNPMLTPAENAQSYFKRYNKQKRTFSALQEQIRQNEEEWAYLDSVLTSLQNAADESDITEIRGELAGQGFVKKRVSKTAKMQKKSKPLHYVSSDGFDIYVGKNNTQNDELTIRFAQNLDIWLHAKDIAGSHVIVRTNGATPPDRTLHEAANLAAYHSKSRQSGQVPVDYTLKKHVRKPNGAKPGYVIYDNNKTAYITPEETTLTQKAD